MKVWNCLVLETNTWKSRVFGCMMFFCFGGVQTSLPPFPDTLYGILDLHWGGFRDQCTYCKYAIYEVFGIDSGSAVDSAVAVTCILTW